MSYLRVARHLVSILCSLGALQIFAGIALSQVPIIQPGAPGQPSREISAEEASDLSGISYTDADVKFMQGMIMHHDQALRMVKLVEDRSTRESLQLMALRMSLSQEDEMTMMSDWLKDRGQSTEVSMQTMMNMGTEQDSLPGMLTEDDFTRLEASVGYTFDTVFLELMIKHHNGAITMVENLLDQRGTAQDSVLFTFTSDVVSDQESEIDRMSAMLAGFSPDPRVNLKAGFYDAGQASLNMTLVASIPKPAGFFDPENPEGLTVARRRALGMETLAPNGEVEDVSGVELTVASEPDADQLSNEEKEEEEEPRPSLLDFSNTDLVFDNDIVVAGNYHGFNAYRLSNPRSPELLSSVVCPGGQGDVSVVGDLLILSVEQTRGRLDCGLQGVAEPTSEDRFRGIRIFDVSDFAMPVQVGAVQTCRGSHTHTVITDPDDEGNIYIYGSGTSRVRPEEELEGCSDKSPFENPGSSLYRIDVIQVPVDSPQDARIVNQPFLFSDPESGVLAGLWEGGDHGPGTQTTRRTNQCHDITAYPEIGLAAGACSGNGILIDISDPVNPVRIDEVVDPGFAYWHSATFNNAGTKVVFTDEWGGGGRPRCRAQDPITWGADAIYDISDGKLQFRGYYKMPAPQTEQENCVAHNGSLIPVPGRDLMIQAWYQGGASVFDFTDSANVQEIAFFDRGPVDEEDLVLGGYWSTYWFQGLIYGTEIARGIDVLALEPSDYLSANEIAAASLNSADSTFNAQRQQRHVWPPVPVVARAYRDQLARAGVLSSERDQELDYALGNAEVLLEEREKDSNMADQLVELARKLRADGEGRRGNTKVRYLALSETVEGIAAGLR